MKRPRAGNSLVELVAAAAIVGLLAAMALPRATGAVDDGDRTSCHVNRAEIELQARLWYRANGSWPATNLSDVGADTGYFPEGVPTCPVDGTAYTLDAATGEVVGHDH